jgi:hypothetical protein
MLGINFRTEQKYTHGKTYEDEKSTNFQRIGEFIQDRLSIFPSLTPKSGEEWQRRVASTAITKSNGKKTIAMVRKLSKSHSR